MTNRRKNPHRWLQRSIVASAFAFLMAVGGMACGANTTEPDYIVDTGTVAFLDIEGGCWVIEGQVDTYEPTNLPAEFKEDGLGVTFLSRLAEDQASVCQVGPRIRLVSIELFGN